MSAYVKCACDESLSFKSPTLWRAHYEDARPRSASARKDWAAIHRPLLAFDSPGRGKAPQRTQDAREARLVQILKEINSAFDYIRLLESEQLTLLKELMPEPTAPLKIASTFFIGRAPVACAKCGRKTKWRKSTVPGGLPWCKNDIHKEAIARGAASRTTPGVSDNVWAILMDEEVE